MRLVTPYTHREASMRLIPQGVVYPVICLIPQGVVYLGIYLSICLPGCV